MATNIQTVGKFYRHVIERVLCWTILSANRIGRFLHDRWQILLADFIGRQNWPTFFIDRLTSPLLLDFTWRQRHPGEISDVRKRRWKTS